jgi:hypothetical protein
MANYDVIRSGLDLGIKAASGDVKPEQMLQGSVDFGLKIVETLESMIGATANAQFGKVLEKEYSDDIPEDVSLDVTETSYGTQSETYDDNWEIEEDITTETTESFGTTEGQFDFNGVDCYNDTEQMDVLLDNFQDDKWANLELEDKKQSMTELADYVLDVTGNENPPEIIFRDDMGDGEYGGYNPSTNTLEINENMLDDSSEAADTVAHELWHAYQQQCAENPDSERGREYQEGFDNYISPEYDFEGYQNQMVEAEARAFAQNFKDRLATLKGGN